MDLFSNLQLLHEAAMSVLITTIYGRWCGTTTNMAETLLKEDSAIRKKVMR